MYVVNDKGRYRQHPETAAPEIIQAASLVRTLAGSNARTNRRRCAQWWREPFRHHSDAALDRQIAVMQRLTENTDFARSQVQQAREAPERGALARAIWPEKAERELPGS